jgi:hypothetical protein
MVHQAHKRARAGDPKYPLIQKDAATHACRADISCGTVAERLPNEIGSVIDVISLRDCSPSQNGLHEAL